MGDAALCRHRHLMDRKDYLSRTTHSRSGVPDMSRDSTRVLNTVSCTHCPRLFMSPQNPLCVPLFSHFQELLDTVHFSFPPTDQDTEEAQQVTTSPVSFTQICSWCKGKSRRRFSKVILFLAAKLDSSLRPYSFPICLLYTSTEVFLKSHSTHNTPISTKSTNVTFPVKWTCSNSKRFSLFT